MKTKTIQHLVAIELTRRRISLVELRRRGSAVVIVRAHVAPLTLDLFNAETEVAVQALRNVLDEAGIRARHCVVCLPLDRLLVHTLQVPALDPADVADFLELEAERLFPHAPEDLAIARSLAPHPDGSQTATLAALPLTQLEALENVLHGARLRVLSLTAGIATLPADAAFYVTEESVQMIVRSATGIALLRGFDEIWAATGEDLPEEAAAEFAREIRLTLRRIPADLRGGLSAVHVLGSAAARERLLQLIEPEARQAGLVPQASKVEALANVEVGSFAPDSLALAGGAAVMRGEPLAFEFHRPRVGRFEQSLRRMLAKGLLWRVAGAAGVLALALAALLIWQGLKLSRLEERWAVIGPQVTQLEEIQDEIRSWRPWFSDDSPTLAMLRALTEAFPETGEVWARRVSIRADGLVECSGLTRDRNAFFRMFGALRQTEGVETINMQQLAGENPVQFTISYSWNPGGGA